MADNEGHKNLHLQPGKLSICAHYGPMRGPCSKGLKCTYLHICRAWLAGHCENGNSCQFCHTLLGDEHNRSILRNRLGTNLPKCDNDMRQNVRRCFLCLCPSYIHCKGYCMCMKKTNKCPNLHLCPQLVNIGVCKNQKCHFNHKWQDGYIAVQLLKVGVKVNKESSDEPPSKFVFANVISSHYLKKSKDRYQCNCISKGSESLSRNDSLETLMSLADVELVDEEFESASENSSDDCVIVQTPSVSGQKKTKQTRNRKKEKKGDAASPPVASTIETPILTFLTLREFLYRNNGKASFKQFLDYFKVHKNFDLISFRDSIDNELSPAKSFINIFSNKKKQVESLEIYSGLRICAFYNENNKCGKEENCPYFHICRFFIADEEGNNHPKKCPKGLVHTFQDGPMRRYLIAKGLGNGYKATELRSLIAAAHPRVCSDYNSVAGCSKKNCQCLHICNNIFTKPCPPTCLLLHDIGALRTPDSHNYKVLFTYMMETVKNKTLRFLILPMRGTAGNVPPEGAKAKPFPEPAKPKAPPEGAKGKPTELMKTKVEPAMASPQKPKKSSANVSKVEESKQEKLGKKLGSDTDEICEHFVRGVCKQSNCRNKHVPKPFLWQFCKDDRWDSFNPKESVAIELAFTNPANSLWCTVLDPSDQYPFSGRVEVHFSLRQLLVRGKPAHEIRCLRTPSNVTLPGHCSASTVWCWYLLDPRSGQWADFRHLPGGANLQLELELAVDRGDSSLDAAHMGPQLNSLPPPLRSFSVDLENMELQTAGSHVVELCRRPAPPPAPAPMPHPMGLEAFAGPNLYHGGGARPKQFHSEENCLLQ